MSVAEDLQFLSELQEELKTQDHDSQASPRFWVIGDYKMIPCRDDDEDDYHVYHHGGDWSDSLDEFLQDVKDNDFEGLTDEARTEFEEGDLSSPHVAFADKEAWVKEYCSDDIELIPVKEQFIVHQNTMFLTKAEAEQHLKLNSHHYSSRAHTYAMTAWRAPMVERLLGILETFDWSLVPGLQTRVKELEEAARVFIAHSATSYCPEQDEDCDKMPSCEACWLRALGLEVPER